MPERTEAEIERMIATMQARPMDGFTPWERQFIADAQEANDGGFLSSRQLEKLEELYAR